MDQGQTKELQRVNYEIAQAIAPTWQQRRADIEDVTKPVRDWLVRELDPQPGDTLLELAAGTGDTGFEAASRLGDTGTLVTSDFSPAMIEGARRRARELGLEGVRFLVIDAHDIEIEDDSVDGVICRFGYMLVLDPDTAFAETRRVLRPGGRLVLAVWGPPPRNPFFTASVGPLVAMGHLVPPDPEGPGIFRFADADALAESLHRAGFAESRIEEVPVHFRVADVDAYLDFVRDTAGPIGLTIRALTPRDRAALAAAASDWLAPFMTSDSLDIPGLALCATAR